jgi:hypothetical protein
MTFRGSRGWEPPHRRKESDRDAKDTESNKTDIRVKVVDLHSHPYVYRCIKKYLDDEHSGVDSEIYIRMGSTVDSYGGSRNDTDSIRFFNSYGVEDSVAAELTSYIHKSPELIGKLEAALDRYLPERITEGYHRIKTDDTRDIQEIAGLLFDRDERYVFDCRTQREVKLNIIVKVKHLSYDCYSVEIVVSNNSNIESSWGAVGTENKVSGYDLSAVLNGSYATPSNQEGATKSKQETKQETQKNKIEEEIKMEKIVMSYEGDLATLTAKGAVVYKNSRLINVGKMYIECKTVELETQTIEAGNLIVKNGKVYGVASADPVKLVDIATGTVADIIIEEGVGGITTYNKIVNPLEMDNPIVSMTMLTNGSQVDPVSQMAMLNMIQSKQKAVAPAVSQDKVLEAIQAQTNLLIALTEKLLNK